jgi:hypothetical protein
MNKIVGISINYSDICKDYNTAYLDRDNKDPATTKCMKSVLAWMETFLTKLTEDYDLVITQLNSNQILNSSEIASKRFLFYSLEKEITLQSFVLQKDAIAYNNTQEWSTNSLDTILIQNDDEGDCLHLYLDIQSQLHSWILDYLVYFTLDEAPSPRL